MANTYTLIASNTLSSSAASVTFSSIPATYTDLVLRISARTDFSTINSDGLNLTINGTSTTIYSATYLTATGTTVASSRASNQAIYNTIYLNGATATTNTFSSVEIYIPSYTVSANKPFSVFNVVEQNSATSNGIEADAGLWRNTAAITTLALSPATGANFVSGSSFFLYGIKNS